MQKLTDFLKEAVGRTYKFSLSYVTKSNRETIVNDLDSDTILDAKRQFFCSELIAKIFKVCNIMEDDGSACSNYLPCHFTTS